EEKVLPTYTGEGQVIRGWSAGCSSGEEAYTLAIILDCFFQDKEIDFKVLATDVNSEVLDYAKKAIYPSERVANIPNHLLKNYFLLGTGENQGFFKVKNELRNNLVFGKVNLNQDNYPIKSKFDFIFCRNVFIYFDQKSREKILDKFYDCLKKDGYLFLGHADGVKIKSNKWRQVWKTTFVKQ
ncbi:MAG: CheR family methyltransferase, partial [bacterium]